MIRSYISTAPDSNAASEITGSGTANTVTKFTAAHTIGDSSLTDDGSKVLTSEPVLSLNNGGQRAITATAGATTTLTVASAQNQIFTGVTTQTVVLPVVTTLLQAGFGFWIINDSSGALTVNSSGSNLVQTVAAGARAFIFCNKITADTTAAAWEVVYQLPASTAGVVNASTATVLATSRAIGGIGFNGSADINPNLVLSTSIADDTYTGSVISGLVNLGGVTQWDLVYLNSSSQWVKADADTSPKYPALGVAVATALTTVAVSVLTYGVFRDDGGTAWTPGGLLYLSETAGGLTQTAPVTSGSVVQIVGYALSAHVVVIAPDKTFITLA